MPFKITKIPKKLGASNKPQTLHENTIASSLPSPIQVLIGGMVTRPFIDRLVITMTVPDATDGIGMYNAHMLLLGDNGTYVSQRPPAGYKRAGKLILESVPNPKKWPFYAFTWKSGPVDLYGAKATFITKLRLECAFQKFWTPVSPNRGQAFR